MGEGIKDFVILQNKILGIKIREEGKSGQQRRDVIYEQPLTCVRPDVTLKKPRPREGFSTNLATTTLAVSSNVHCKGRHRHIDLSTLDTFLGLLVCQRSGNNYVNLTKIACKV